MPVILINLYSSKNCSLGVPILFPAFPAFSALIKLQKQAEK